MEEKLNIVTEVAVGIILNGAKAIVEKKAWTPDEIEGIGRSIGWLSVVVVGSDKDVFDTLIEGSNEVSEALKTPSGPMGMEIGKERSAVMAGGKRKGRKMRGGVPPLMILLLGAVALIFGGNQATTIMTLQQQRVLVRQAAMAQIKAACPIDLIPEVPPASRLLDWGGGNARELMKFQADMATCNAVRSAAAARIQQADALLKQAFDQVPIQVATFSTAASIIVSGAPTTASLTTAAAVGTAMQQLTSTVISGQMPQGRGLTTFVQDLNAAFPIPSPSPPPPPPPPSGGRRKTGKKSKGKKRTTVRRRRFLY